MFTRDYQRVNHSSLTIANPKRPSDHVAHLEKSDGRRKLPPGGTVADGRVFHSNPTKNTKIHGESATISYETSGFFHSNPTKHPFCHGKLNMKN
jgi:hypothetical protein